MIDGSGSVAAPVAMLVDTGSALELTLVVDTSVTESKRYERWWSRNANYGDDPDRVLRSYAPPRSLGFRDGYGSLVLVGCRATDARNTIMRGTGHGVVVANYAVHGARVLAYETINGMRTEAPAIAAWTRLSGISVDIGRDDRNRAESVRMDLETPEPIRLASSLNLAMRMSWRTEAPLGGFTAEEAVQLQTLVKDRRSWDEHLELHSRVLQLASIAAWKPFGFSKLEVQIDDDRVRTRPDGWSDPRWLEVSTHRLLKHSVWEKEPRFLFPFSEVGTRGVKRWLSLRKEYERMVDPLLSVLHSDDPWGTHSVVQSGIALEALGYLVDVKKNEGKRLNARGQMNFKPGLRVILDDMASVPIEDPDGWVERCNAAYMGAKHIDRPMPDTLDMINTLRENILVMRFWIGQQLGVSAETLRVHLAQDGLRSPFISVD